MVVINRNYPKAIIMHVVYDKVKEGELTSCCQCVFRVEKKCTAKKWEKLKNGKITEIECNDIYKIYRRDKRYKNQKEI